jgi:Sec-independent protein translocase protein TatA
MTNKMQRISLLIIVILLTVMPVMAQADTSADDTQTDVNAVLSALEWKDIVIIALVIVIVFQAVKTKDLLPMSVVLAIVGELKTAAAKTENRYDDVVINALNDAIKAAQKPDA